MNKISIITPTFNRAHTLSRVYESLKAQTFKDFVWIIMDDGSTDNTEDIVKHIINEKLLNIQYHKKQNSKKFHTVFKGVELVQTPFFTVLDSDDAYPSNALEIMLENIENLDDNFISVVGLSQDEDSKIVGDEFPKDPFDSSILIMRYKYKVRGDKHAIFKTLLYKEFLKKFNYEIYKGQYAPQKIFFSIYDAQNKKTRFINKVVRTYYKNETDKSSMSKDRIKSSSYLGLRDGHKAMINNYEELLFKIPEALLRNLIGYLVYSHKMNDKVTYTISEIRNKKIRNLAFILLPFTKIYAKI